jgi:mono/diheme cytochrome c family protein
MLARGLPLIAAVLMLAPAVAFSQSSSEAPASSEASASSEAPASSEAAPIPAAGTVASYTEEQAKRGKGDYDDNCSGCHGTTLGGSGEAPGVVGKGFRERWFIGSPEPIYTFVSANMPQGAQGTLPPEMYADIVAYLMSKNKVPAGDTELPHDPAALTNIVLPALTE